MESDSGRRGKMLMAHRIALDPNDDRVAYLVRKDPRTLCRLFHSIKREQFPWMLEVTTNAPQMAIVQLGKAFNFGCTNYPQCHKKDARDRFTLTNDPFAKALSQKVKESKNRARGKTKLVRMHSRISNIHLGAIHQVFPSSKACSNCGDVLMNLPLSVRQWDCYKCNRTNDRDVHTAKNLVVYAVSSTVNACRGNSSGQTDVPYGETVLMKQEVNINIYL